MSVWHLASTPPDSARLVVIVNTDTGTMTTASYNKNTRSKWWISHAVFNYETIAKPTHWCEVEDMIKIVVESVNE